MTLRINKNSKSVKLVKDIIATEELELNVNYTVDALGDSIILIEGDKEEVRTLKEIYEMVK